MHGLARVFFVLANWLHFGAKMAPCNGCVSPNGPHSGPTWPHAWLFTEKTRHKSPAPVHQWAMWPMQGHACIGPLVCFLNFCCTKMASCNGCVVLNGLHGGPTWPHAWLFTEKTRHTSPAPVHQWAMWPMQGHACIGPLVCFFAPKWHHAMGMLFTILGCTLAQHGHMHGF